MARQRPLNDRRRLILSDSWLVGSPLPTPSSLRTPDLVELGWTGSAQKLGAGRFLDKWFLWR